MNATTEMANGHLVALAETVQRLRAECAELSGVAEQLWNDLEEAALALATSSRMLAEREAELVEQRRTGERLSHQFEQQEARLAEVLSELKSLREAGGKRRP